MNDRYLFKAKRIDNGEWVQGALLDGENHCLIGQEIRFSPYVDNECKIVGHEVDRTTICACTGLYDKEKRLIWENDIVEISKEDGCFSVDWDEDTARFMMNRDGLTVDFDNYWSHEVEVVGNRVDNPELLEVERWN